MAAVQPLLAPGQQGMSPAVPGVRSPATAAAYAILGNHKKLQLRQLRQWMEAMTGFEKNNKYVLRDEQGKDVFFVSENSTCMERLCAGCFGGTCKAWRMDLYLLGEGGIEGGMGSMTPFIHLERPCHATFLCWNRPEVVVTDMESQAKIGTVREPFTCCNLSFQVLDGMDKPSMDVNASCCQPGLVCPAPCEQCAPCHQIEFPITDHTSGASVGNITKTWMWGDFIQCLGEWDNYTIDFGDAQNPDFKVLLLSAAIFAQMRYFDKRNKNGNQ